MVLSLPPIPLELKSVTPYLQRADELASNDPVISYWCAYYAAQQGIALKLKDSAARHFLFDLLGLLERMKTDLGANDAVHDELASAAYIENFGLRVFANADTEDRKGSSTRGTAKKFLAAANFLELLRVFDNDKGTVDLPSIEEKIKYAKWKAADIAKAIREGRKPTPGPAASEVEELPPVPDGVPDVSIIPPTTPPSSQSPLPSRPSPPSLVRSTPPPAHLTNLPPVDHTEYLGAQLPDGLAPPQPPQSPGAWSTAATPGTPGFHLDDAPSPIDVPSGSPLGEGRPMAFVSGELEGKSQEEIDAEGSPPTSAGKSVHFAASVAGGLDTPSAPGPDDDPFAAPLRPSAPPLDAASGFYVPGPPSFSPPAVPPPPHGHSPSARTSRSPPSAPGSAHASPKMNARTATVTVSPVELTPQVIARAQKHCRFAISALDYEDATQAIKELREALRMLGG